MSGVAARNFRVDRLIDSIEGAMELRAGAARGGQGSTDSHQHFVKAVTNYLVLLYQQPCFVSLRAWDEGGAETAFFSSLPERDRLFLGLPRPSWSGPQEATPSTDRRHVYFAGNRRQGLEVVIEHRFYDHSLLADVSPKDLGEVIHSCREQLLESLLLTGWGDRPVKAPTEETWAAEVPIALQDEIVGPFRYRLGAFFGELAELGGAFGVADPEVPINLFAVARHQLAPWQRSITPPPKKSFVERRCTTYDYTASLLLTHSQQAWVDDLAAGSLESGTEPWRLLELPLGRFARSIGDTVFDSGILDFSLPSEREAVDWSRDFASADLEPREVQRRQLETRVYATFRGGSDPIIFYSPIHVSGRPWLALFTFCPHKPGSQGTRSAWLHSYHAYRDQLPRIADQLRELAQQAYSDSLASFLSKSLGSGNVVEQVNQYWQALSRFYPFPVAQLVPSGEDSARQLEFPDGGRWALDFKHRGGTDDDLSLGLLRPGPIKESLEATLKAARTIRAQTQVSVLDGVAHGAYNTMGALGSALFCKTFGDAVPPNELKHTVHNPATGARDLMAEATLLRKLRTLYAAEEATRGSLALGRILAAKGVVRSQFTWDAPYSLSDLVNEAREMALVWAETDPGKGVRPVEIQESLNSGPVKVKRGYLAPGIVRSIVFEILSNSARYALSDPITGSVGVRVSYLRDEENRRLAIRFASRAPRDSWHFHPRKVVVTRRRLHAKTLQATFLFRFANIAEVLQGGLAIETTLLDQPSDADGRKMGHLVDRRLMGSDALETAGWYFAELQLGALSVDDGRQDSQIYPV